MSSLEGQIRITLGRGRNKNVRVESQRLLTTSRLLRGKSPEQAITVIPLLYNICGISQACAASQAMEQAGGEATEPDLQCAREMLSLVEAAREHLARILIDWPHLIGRPLDTGALPRIGQLPSLFRTLLFRDARPFGGGAVARIREPEIEEQLERLETLLADHVFGTAPDEWSVMKTIEEMIDWYRVRRGIAAHAVALIHKNGWASQGKAGCRALPDMPSGELAARLARDSDGSFVARPVWDDEPHETNSYTRQRRHPLIEALNGEFGDGLLTRWMARLVELAQLPDTLRQHLAAAEVAPEPNGCAPNTGIGMVEAARGRLYHWVALEGGRIVDYRILAPTEWNFHPQGLIMRSLTNIQANDDEEKLHIARLLVNAIDPCVACTPEFSHA